MEEKESRQHFTFHANWLESISMLPTDLQDRFIGACVRYGLEHKDTDFEDPLSRALWFSLRSMVELGWKNYRNGKQPKGRTGPGPPQTENISQDPKDIEAICKVFYFSNIKNARAEAERFWSYNAAKGWTTKDGKAWDTAEKRILLAKQWTPQEKGDRCNIEFLKMWERLYNSISKSAPEVACKMLDDRIKGGWLSGNTSPTIYCPSLVSNFIREHMDVLNPIIQDWSKAPNVFFKLP